jgi:hypothetical protein
VVVADDEYLVEPFTEAEIYAAHRLIMSEEKARDFVDQLREHVRTTEGTPVWTDDSLLLFAVLSDDSAARVVEQAPDLETVVRRIRAEPDSWREIWDTHVQGL